MLTSSSLSDMAVYPSGMRERILEVLNNKDASNEELRTLVRLMYVRMELASANVTSLGRSYRIHKKVFNSWRNIIAEYKKEKQNENHPDPD